jgi:hypothetical protein
MNDKIKGYDGKQSCLSHDSILVFDSKDLGKPSQDG